MLAPGRTALYSEPMRPADTSPEAQRIMDEHYRRMTPAEKMAQVQDAWRSARILALAGLRLDFPDATEQELEDRWAERRLGTRLFKLADARRRELADRSDY